MDKRLYALRLTGIGFYIATCIILGVVGGLWLDGQFQTKPVLVILGLILGLLTAVIGTYRMLKPLVSDKQSGEDE